MLVSISEFERALELSEKAILQNKLIIYPTDTVYGIGANALNESAVKKIFEVKRREEKPISIVVSDLNMLCKYCKVSSREKALLEKIFPGPFTVILLKKYPFPSYITKTEKIGVRVPEYFFVLTLVKKLGFPITTTSANISGEKSPSSIQEIGKELMEKVDVVVDGGECKYGIGSTVVDITGKEPKILRKGAGYEKIFK